MKRLQDLQAFQRANEFKAEVYRLIAASDAIQRDEKFRQQLSNAAASVAANIAEGWGRFEAGEMRHFLRYARASSDEALTWIRDGVARGYFSNDDASHAFSLADQCRALITGLWNSLGPFVKSKR